MNLIEVEDYQKKIHFVNPKFVTIIFDPQEDNGWMFFETSGGTRVYLTKDRAVKFKCDLENYNGN